MLIDRPLKFRPSRHPALWGEESWEVSVHPSDPSVVAEGPLAGRSLAELCPGFPLLVKVIDAKTRLSVQVHPNENTCRLTGGAPKTEMWRLLDDGVIYAGLKRGVTAADVERAVASGGFEELMVRHEAKRGEAFFIPGGMVHAIGDDTRLYEVQQSSDTTFRLYDWDRVDAQGRRRELHVAQALQAIDYTLGAPTPRAAVTCGFFDFRPLELAGRLPLGVDARARVFFVAAGAVTANGVEFAAGESGFVAPGTDLTLAADAPAEVLFTVPGQGA